ncbi:protein of unknown function [Geosporobacter subterraneus DSM 17957]|uniref:DUF4363 family protein n=1 Tax=Geosporobacter subterraneus DSM 17957 TaxID=1121919 RepID=A0A1M6LME2_9FIRM|nr:DUF4363 family protein [Geosporobacter subterraneus]SHJ72367.1 protein of unknown function [Geosporobacter subterraneus DSM 17957]
MRAFIISSAAVLLIITGWIFLYQSVEHQTAEFVEALSQLTKTLNQEDWETAASNFKEIRNKWQITRNKWTIFLHHHEIDNIDLSMARTVQYIETKNKPLSLGETEALKQLFHIVKENEALTLTNVL